MARFLLNAWYAVGFSSDLEVGGLREVQVIGEPLVLYRGEDGVVRALESRCAHRAAPLSMGRVEGNDLRCMYHGLRFDAEGRCQEVPGQAQVTDDLRVRAFPLHEQDGWLWVWMGDPARADMALVPAAMGLSDERWTLVGSHMDYDANHALISDNLCDFSHLAFVHVNSFGEGDAAQMAEFATRRPQIEQLPRGIRVSRWATDRHALPFLQVPGGDGRLDSFNTYDYLAPGVLLMWSAWFPLGSAQASDFKRPEMAPLHSNFASQAVTPLDEKRTRYYFTWGPSTAENRPFLKDIMMDVTVKAFLEDRLIIEGQQRILDLTPNVQFRPIVHDRGPNLMRTVMERLMKEDGRSAVSAAA